MDSLHLLPLLPVGYASPVVITWLAWVPFAFSADSGPLEWLISVCFGGFQTGVGFR